MAIELPAVRILIVDDDRAICDYMQTLLERDGYQVKTLSDPTPGRRRGSRTAATTCIILDLMMPKLDGIEVLQAHPQDRQRHRRRHLHRLPEPRDAPSPR